MFLAQMFAISDTCAAVVTVDCLPWRCIAALWLLGGPVAFIVLSGCRVHTLVKTSKTLNFNPSPTHTLKSMWSGLTEAPGLVGKSSQCFIYGMDLRWAGGWAKKDDLAKFWGWMLGAYTDKFLPLITWLLLKKVFNALNKNWLDGKYNAVAHVVIYSVDVALFCWFRPFRDHTVNMSQSLGAISNLLGILVAALPILIPDLVPDWFDGFLVMIISSAGTAVMAIQALMDPIFKLTGTLFIFTGKAAGILESVGTALWVRFQIIFMGRTKRAASRRLAAEKARQAPSEAKGMQSNKAAAIMYEGKVYKKGIYNPSYKERYLVLRDGVLTWYKISDLVVNEDDAYDFEHATEVGAWECNHNTIELVQSNPSSEFHATIGHGWGFVLTNKAKQSKRIMVKLEMTRDAWVSRLRLAIDALGEGDEVAEEASLAAQLSMGEHFPSSYSAVIDMKELQAGGADLRSLRSKDPLNSSNACFISSTPIPITTNGDVASSSLVYIHTPRDHLIAKNSFTLKCQGIQASGANASTTF